ncbi:hypothetical protein L4D77_17860 [Photobacterium frigidiphilum]|uniref:GapS4b family protein n=1 Tax=Photobacterium frigidiphilum TaxID=264736 RepID=UPI003D131B54
MSNDKYLLPFGDALRDFLNDGSVSKSDLRGIVRRRGIFVNIEDKSSYIPILVRTGITPLELLDLSGNMKVRETNPKRQTQSIKCESESTDLINAIPVDYDAQAVIKKEFSNYRLLGAPSFKRVEKDSNHVELDFEIERFDHTQPWNKNTTYFSGKVKFKKKEDTLDINISLSHTSPETKEVANKIAADYIKHLKESGCIKSNEKVQKIRFMDFSNKNRINFLQSLSQKQLNNELFFKDTKDIGFCPEASDSFPEKISWMQEKVSNLVIQGKKLHSTFFFKDVNLYEHIQIHKVEASYSFDFSEYGGSCDISFEFPEFSSKKEKESELVIKVTRVHFREGLLNPSKEKIKEILLSQLENSKLEMYKQYSLQTAISDTTADVVEPQLIPTT